MKILELKTFNKKKKNNLLEWLSGKFEEERIMKPYLTLIESMQFEDQKESRMKKNEHRVRNVRSF